LHHLTAFLLALHSPVPLPAVWYVQFPISGRFSEDQRAVYEGVLNAQRAVLQVMVPGTSWPECHRVATREVIKALLKVRGVCFSTYTLQTSFVWCSVCKPCVHSSYARAARLSSFDSAPVACSHAV
jgi:hypothetical protein